MGLSYREKDGSTETRTRVSSIFLTSLVLTERLQSFSSSDDALGSLPRAPDRPRAPHWETRVKFAHVELNRRVLTADLSTPCICSISPPGPYLSSPACFLNFARLLGSHSYHHQLSLLTPPASSGRTRTLARVRLISPFASASPFASYHSLRRWTAVQTLNRVPPSNSTPSHTLQPLSPLLLPFPPLPPRTEPTRWVAVI
jgi:hypothetical protein